MMETLVRIVAALATLLAFTSCHPGEAQDSMLIAGSSTMNQHLKQVFEAFKKEHPTTTFEFEKEHPTATVEKEHPTATVEKEHPTATVFVEAGGAVAGIIAVKRGAIDIATAPRDLSPSEDEVGVRDYLVARDGIAIIVNPENRVDGLTLEQVEQIVTGKVTSWKEVGGDESAIDFIDRWKDSSTRQSLIDLLLKGDDTLAGRREVHSRDDMVRAVAGGKNAIGFVSWSSRTGDLGEHIKLVNINGVPFTRETLLSGRYPLARSFYLVVYLKPSLLAEQFVEFTRSNKGQYLEKEGLLGVQ